MTQPGKRAAALLQDKPDVEPVLREIVEADENGPWGFDDIDIDSGLFGEIVSRKFVEEEADGYRLVDRDAVQQVLQDEEVVNDDPAEMSLRPSISLSVNRWTAAIGGGILVAALVRVAFIYTGVYRGDDIVLAGNDPYFYLQLVQTLQDSGLEALDPTALTSLPQRIKTGDALLVVLLWWTAEIMGGGTTATANLIAWYPVVAGVSNIVIIYFVALRLTNDRRVSLAATLLLGITPVHAFRTALGFSDHDPFDLLVLGIIVFALVELMQRRSDSWFGDLRQPSYALGAAAFGVAIAAQIMSWRGAPILLLPIGAYIAVLAVFDLHHGSRPLSANSGLLFGLWTGALLTLAVHLSLGWMPLFRAATPLLLAGGALVTLFVAHAVSRQGWSVRHLITLEAVGAIGGITVLYTVPPLSTGVSSFLTYMQVTTGSNVAETKSLFAPQLGSIGAPLLFFGTAFYMALPYLGVLSHKLRRDAEAGWLVAVTFGWCFLFLSILQVRFAVYLSLFLALFAGLGFIHLASVVDLAKPVSLGERVNHRISPALDSFLSRHTVYIIALFALLFGFGVVQTATKTQQIAVDDDIYKVGNWVGDYAEENDLRYPENSVFSQWDTVRIYNHLSGANTVPQNWARGRYDGFITSRQPTQWYDRLSGNAGFVVVSDSLREMSEETLGARLSVPSDSNRAPSVGHYRLVRVSAGGTSIYTLERGAVITGTVPLNGTVTLSANVSVNGAEYTYRRTVRPDDSGQISVTVPYATQYRIGNRTVSVSEAEVQNGTVVPFE